MWISLNKITEGEVIAIDGKTLRHSYDKGKDKSAIHMVSAWATTNRLVLGQCKVDEKSNEITAIPELIKVLEIAGCIVTIDAMGCQKQIVKSIVDKSGEYVIALKKNQGNLYKNVVIFTPILKSSNICPKCHLKWIDSEGSSRLSLFTSVTI